MAISVKLLTNNSEKNKVEKNLTELKVVSGTLRAECALIDPVIEISGAGLDIITKVNYIRIQSFGRYYFVNEIESVRTGIWRLHCHVDVLQSFKDQIRQQTAVILRQESKYNLFLDDGIFKTYQNPKITTHKFPAGLTSESFVLAVAGG